MVLPFPACSQRSDIDRAEIRNDRRRGDPIHTLPPGTPIGAVAAAAARRRPVVLMVGAEDSGALLCSRILTVLGIRMAGRGTEEARAGRSLHHGAAARPGAFPFAALYDRILALFGDGDAEA